MNSDSKIVEHQDIPVAHQGLHSFLYSSDDEHRAVSTAPVASANEQSDALVPLTTWCDRVGDAKIAAVYAVLDQQQQTQYIGYSRDVRVALQGHLAQNGGACAFVRVQAFKFPKRAEMEELRDRWIADLGNVPPGNGAGERWAGSIAEAATAMSSEERTAYEEKKLKLRKAMADSTLSQPEASETKQQDLKSAMQEDDWSAVVQSQTQETLD